MMTFFFWLQTDEVHAKDNTRPGANTAGKQQTFMKRNKHIGALLL